jgi:hypothetical protein
MQDQPRPKPLLAAVVLVIAGANTHQTQQCPQVQGQAQPDALPAAAELLFAGERTPNSAMP